MWWLFHLELHSEKKRLKENVHIQDFLGMISPSVVKFNTDQLHLLQHLSLRVGLAVVPDMVVIIRRNTYKAATKIMTYHASFSIPVSLLKL